jgi:hypothetical protein
MMKKLSLLLLAAALLLSACQPAAAPTPTSQPTVDVPPEPGTGYPAPGTDDPGDDLMNAYPGPGQDPGEPLFNVYPPTPDDARMERGNFFFEAATLMPQEGQPGVYDLYIEGSLPTPCNAPRVQINPPDANNRILVDLYSVIDPEMMCTQVIQPFAGQVATLGGYPSGTYQVMIEGQTVGELTVP